MPKLTVNSQQKTLPSVGQGVLMIHQDPPAFLVLATGPVRGDEFPGVALESGAYGEQWIVTEFQVFDGSITLEQ